MFTVNQAHLCSCHQSPKTIQVTFVGKIGIGAPWLEYDDEHSGTITFGK